jgi:hypothetical protein
VGGDFDDVVGGVGVRFGEVGDDDFIDAIYLPINVRRSRADLGLRGK